MPDEAWDIVVVGAGPAGAATAMLAARTGRRVALIDAAHFPRQKVCGEYLSAAAWQLLDRWGSGSLRQQAAPLDALRLIAATGRSLEMTFDGEERERPASLSRYVFDRRLVEGAVAAGAKLYEGRRLREVNVVAGRVGGATFVDVADPTATMTLTTTLLIAADGRRSQVVRQTGTLRQGRGGLVGYKRHVAVADRSRYERRIVLHSLAGGYVGICPVEDGRLNVCGLIPRDVLRAARGNMTTALTRWSGDPELMALLAGDADSDADEWHTIPEVAWQTASPSVEGVLYVGDAMGTIEPLTGQGMTMALAGAELLSQRLTDLAARNADRTAQQAYEAEWHATFDRSIAAARWFGRLLRSPRLLAGVIVAAGSLPGMADRLVRSFHERTLTVHRVSLQNV